MVCLGNQGRRRPRRVQGSRGRNHGWAGLNAPLALGCLLALSGCGNQNPLMTPVGWWHDLQGGAIASERPPPPGADLPYPKIYSIPPKPELPSNAYRVTVETQLAEERDATERLAAHTPIIVQPAPPVPPKPPATPANAAAEAASATVPAADAPAPKPAADAAGAPLVIAGSAESETGLPDVPAAPPPPATFEGVSAEPQPSKPPPLPPRQPPAGAAVFFRPGDAVLDSSQGETIKYVASHRGNGAIEVEGHGDAQSDAPAAQEAAERLGLRRAEAVAKALEAQHVPAAAIRISATAFERGASVRDVP